VTHKIDFAAAAVRLATLVISEEGSFGAAEDPAIIDARGRAADRMVQTVIERTVTTIKYARRASDFGRAPEKTASNQGRRKADCMVIIDEVYAGDIALSTVEIVR
jgi:hypothetical protein